jgi:hypothetical protein
MTQHDQQEDQQEDQPTWADAVRVLANRGKATVTPPEENPEMNTALRALIEDARRR